MSKKKVITDLSELKILLDNPEISDTTKIPETGEVTTSRGVLQPEWLEKFNKAKHNDKFNKQIRKPSKKKQNEK